LSSSIYDINEYMLYRVRCKVMSIMVVPHQVTQLVLLIMQNYFIGSTFFQRLIQQVFYLLSL